MTYLVWILVLFISKNKRSHFLKKVLFIFALIGFSYIWFVPIEIGWKNDLLPVCKFRFQIFEYDTHDYSGYGNFNDLLFSLEPKKYGMIDIHKKIGSWQEYFEFNTVENLIDNED
ncbi:hypothetical protein M4I21_18430 [Cellulophaga sp. 20_2_10]|uniref:hypothetical protein n=1 Tax=Cellulophaga sp. 20_2_10 TaxID=2942476 RepID=UPI00201AD640|nr:hypothetical protein [Cellulophaga sp. 20_2_10]MCL5247790.1 hypothetical protein [Cellulophaga sp. 20_2_10]